LGEAIVLNVRSHEDITSRRLQSAPFGGFAKAVRHQEPQHKPQLQRNNANPPLRASTNASPGKANGDYE